MFNAVIKNIKQKNSIKTHIPKVIVFRVKNKYFCWNFLISTEKIRKSIKSGAIIDIDIKYNEPLSNSFIPLFIKPIKKEDDAIKI